MSETLSLHPGRAAGMNGPWLIYGATGYTGQLIAREAARRGMSPILAGRSEIKLSALAGELGLDFRVFTMTGDVSSQLTGLKLVLHCAGPFSETSEPMVAACLEVGAHYLDITGEIDVFEAIHAMGDLAKKAGVVLCPGVGFDVIPTDCLAACLKEALPDAVGLSLAFDSHSSLSPGTAKTSVEGMGMGGRIRRAGVIEKVKLGYRFRAIDFGAGQKTAVTIPWGDVSTAWHSTRIPNIETYMTGTPGLLNSIMVLRYLRPIIAMGPIQRFLKKRIELKVKGPEQQRREKHGTLVWGEAVTKDDRRKIARLTCANGYDLTVTGSLAVVEKLLVGEAAPGCFTPSQLMGARFVETLPHSSPIVISDQ